MAKNLSSTGEAGAALTEAPSVETNKPPADGAPAPAPSAKSEDPKSATIDLQKLVDAEAEKEKPEPVKVPTGANLFFGHLRLPVGITLEGVTLATPEEHAKTLPGGVKEVERFARVGNQSETFTLFHQQHAAAEALHGWKQHAHHEGAPILLTKEAYENALRAAGSPVTRVVKDFDGKGKLASYKPGDKVDSYKAAELGVPTTTDYEPHPQALSQHAGKGL